MGKSDATIAKDFVFSVEGTSSTGSTYTQVDRTSKSPSRPPDSVIREAIKNHLRYLKSMGKTHISAQDVARSLSLSIELVKRVAVQVGATLED